MVAAQLAERSLPIPEVRGSNPVICKKYNEHLFTVNCIEKMKIKKKGAGIGPFKKDMLLCLFQVISSSKRLKWAVLITN